MNTEPVAQCLCVAGVPNYLCPYMHLEAPTQRSNWDYCIQGHPFHHDAKGWAGYKVCPTCGLEKE